MVQYTLEQRVFLYGIQICQEVSENFYVNFFIKEFPAEEQFTIWWINVYQWDRQKHEHQMLTEEKLDDTGARI
jgi:hypothetical protein